ncbi:MAG: flagellar biosynthetic protein FliR [Nitrospirae bacterium]|nr:flagellar biosynthetic protein FliR [Nitrospirota bacterium]
MEAVHVLIQGETEFVLVLIRVAAMLAAIPVVGGLGVPNLVKVWFAVAIALALLPVVTIRLDSSHAWALGVGFVGEALIGAAIGLAVRLVFAAVDVGAELAGLQMGFGIATVFDPTSSRQISLIGQLYGLVAMLIFFAVDGHHLVLYALVESFRVVPSLTFFPSRDLIEGLMRLAGAMFVTGVQVAVPVVTAMLLASAALGIMGRVVPQMNVLMMSFPVTMGLGLIVVGASLSLFGGIFAEQTRGLGGTLSGLMGTMHQAAP